MAVNPTTGADAVGSPAGPVAGPPAGAAGPPAGLANIGPRRRRSLGTRRQRVVALLVILAALGFLLWRGLSNATEYFKTTTEAVQQKAQLGSRDFRIEGTVENDVHKVGNQTAFTIYGSGTAVQVVSTGSPTQLFKPGIPVVLDGHWAGDVYMSDLIMVKHSANYVEAHPDRLKSQLPSTTTPTGAGTPAGAAGT